MALTSPGVEVTITDESQYLPAPTNSVPLVLIATQQNKANAAGTGVAPGTTAANANKLYQVTTQRDLVNLFGTPYFYSATNGTPLQGYELNEYGLFAAYSLLGGGTNRCYVLRADINLASLVGKTSRPTGAPDNGTYWLNSLTSTWGIYEFNATTGDFELQTPIVITDAAYLSGGAPLDSLGNIGDYAVYANDITNVPSSNPRTYWHKGTNNIWNALGGGGWRSDTTTVQGTQANPSLNAGDTFDIDVSGYYTITIEVPASPNDNLSGVVAAINTLNTPIITARAVNSKIQILSNQVLTNFAPAYFEFTEGSGTALADLGILEQKYYQPTVAYGTAAQMPLWSASQTIPRPTGSVWIKVGSSGNGLNSAMSVYNTATASWLPKNVPAYISTWAALAALDSTGGQAIPANTVMLEYTADGTSVVSPLYYYKRVATGPTVIVGDDTSPTFTGGDMYVSVSIPGSTSLSASYTVVLNPGDTAVDFVTAWAAAGIPYTSATVTTDGAIQLTHTAGGDIVLSDVFNMVSNGSVAEAGFSYTTNTDVTFGPAKLFSWSNVPQDSTTGSGSGASFNIQSRFGAYWLNGNGIYAGGTGYNLGDEITIDGADLSGATGANNLTLVVTEVSGGIITGVAYQSGSAITNYNSLLSNWREFTFIANEGAPVAEPLNNTNWFYSVVNQVDIMVQKNGNWIGYRNTAYDSNGFPAATGSNTTDPAGPICSASAPTTQSDGTALSYGDIWIDLSNLELYPIIRRWQSVGGVDQWVLIDNTDQTSSKGVTFLDARWATNGSTSVTDDPIPTIASLLTSNYLDLDAPTPSTYPTGMLLFNTRRSGYNVKQYKVNYFNSEKYPDATLPIETSAWVTVSGNMEDGSPYMGRNAQRSMVVQALSASIDTNTAIRDEDNYFNLIATPNYPELQPNMVVLNSDRGETAFIVGDTPMGLPDQATAITNWANNTAQAVRTGEDGLVTRNTYLGLFYPSGLATDPSGKRVAVPPSHMMLRTFLRSDANSLGPWFAAAGTRRGTIDNALSLGYVNRTTGEFTETKTRLGIRDVLYTNQINPLVNFTGNGLLCYGNKSSFNSQSALDRINVARLVNFVRRQLTIAARPFVFEPNDALTRAEIAGVVETLMIELVTKRGIYDYLVQCDEDNNTPERIDRNELWVNVAIEPVKAAEFIYIPVRILNTGELTGA